ARCQANKTWDPPVPVCEKVVKCLPPPSIANGEHSSHFSDTFDVGALVHYRCKHGFSLIGSQSVRCTAYGVWSHPLPRCEEEVCVMPYALEMIWGAVSAEGWGRAGSVCGIWCHGSEHTAVHRRSGVSPLAHMSSVLICTSLLSVRHCLKPADIAHGSLSGPAKMIFSPGTSVSYMCKPGFSLIGTASIYCTQSGAWSHPPPVCQVVKCFYPPNITNGKLQGNISDTFSYGVSVSYSCNPGYSLVGNAFITCTASGAWSQPLPRCKEIRCVFPEIQGVKKAIKENTYRSGTNITLECDDGYTLEGISQIQCQEDFSWDPPVPACKLTSQKTSSVGLGVAAAGVLLLLGAGIAWKIISKQKEGYYNTYENYSYQTPLN
ncbi:Complement receptor type 1, partial [Eurypyga helias]